MRRLVAFWGCLGASGPSSRTSMSSPRTSVSSSRTSSPSSRKFRFCSKTHMSSSRRSLSQVPGRQWASRPSSKTFRRCSRTSWGLLGASCGISTEKCSTNHGFYVRKSSFEPSKIKPLLQLERAMRDFDNFEINLPFGAILVPTCFLLGFIFRVLGRLGDLLGPLGGVLGHLGGVLGRLGASWDVLEASWRRFRPQEKIVASI